MTTRVARNAAVFCFLAVALFLPAHRAQANPFESICQTTQTQCYAYFVDFAGCTSECAELFAACTHWCGEVGEFPIDWSCDPESGTPTAGWCYCSGCPQ
jgi:hypothetical protein